MLSYEATTRRICAAVGLVASSRTSRSCAMARLYMSRAASCPPAALAKASAPMRHAAVTIAASIRCFIGTAYRSCASTSSKYSFLTSTSRGLPPAARRDQPVHLHHVDQPRGAAEADPQPPLQVRDRRLAARDDDPRGLVVELVLVELACSCASPFSSAVIGRRRRSACPACAGSWPAARSPVRRCTARAGARSATRPAAGRACRPCRAAARRRCRRGSCASRSSRPPGTRCAPACWP